MVAISRKSWLLSDPAASQKWRKCGANERDIVHQRPPMRLRGVVQPPVRAPAASERTIFSEDRLGVRLLMRSTHGLMPTDAGRDFYEHAKRRLITRQCSS